MDSCLGLSKLFESLSLTFTEFVKLSAKFLQMYSKPHSSPFGTPMAQMFHFLTLSHRILKLCLLSFNIFSLLFRLNNIYSHNFYLQTDSSFFSYLLCFSAHIMIFFKLLIIAFFSYKILISIFFKASNALLRLSVFLLFGTWL